MTRTKNHPSHLLAVVAVIVGALVVIALAVGDVRALLRALTTRPSSEEREGIDG